MFTVIGARTMAIRGDFMLYLLTGIFMYLVHIQALQAVMASENSTSPDDAARADEHAGRDPVIGALGSLREDDQPSGDPLHLHTLIQPIEIYDWSSAMMMYLLAWGSGCAIGLILMALKPWAPDVVTIVQLVYVRANMIASGKMFVANTLPGFMLAMFDWNPLFHIIDQTRGYVFVNYVPHYSNWQYPLYATLVPDHARHDGGILHPQARIDQLGRAALRPRSVHDTQRQVDPSAPADRVELPGRMRSIP
jgi:xanthosine utilization system XapX-like protein